MKGQDMPKIQQQHLGKLSNIGKWLETKHNSKRGGASIIGNIDVDVGKFNLNDTLFL